MKEKIFTILLIFSFFIGVICPPKKKGIMHNNFLIGENQEDRENQEKETENKIRRSKSVDLIRNKKDVREEERENEKEVEEQQLNFNIKRYLPSRGKYLFDFITGLVTSLTNLNQYEIRDKLTNILKEDNEGNKCSSSSLYFHFKTRLREDNIEEFQKLNPKLLQNQKPLQYINNCLNIKKEAEEKLNTIQKHEKWVKKQVGEYSSIIDHKTNLMVNNYQSLEHYIEKKGNEKSQKTTQKIFNFFNLGKNKKGKKEPINIESETGAEDTEKKKTAEVVRKETEINILKKEIEEITKKHNQLEEELSNDKIEKNKIYQYQLKRLIKLDCPLYCSNPIKGLTVNGLLNSIANMIDFFKLLFHCLYKDEQISMELNKLKYAKSENLIDKVINFLDTENLNGIIVKISQEVLKKVNFPFKVVGSGIKMLKHSFTKNYQKMNFYKGRLYGFLLLYIVKAEDLN